MLEYVKMILKKVSFDRKLLRKEYRKSLRWLSKNEAEELKSWARHQQTAESARVVVARRITQMKE